MTRRMLGQHHWSNTSKTPVAPVLFTARDAHWRKLQYAGDNGLYVLQEYSMSLFTLTSAMHDVAAHPLPRHCQGGLRETRGNIVRDILPSMHHWYGVLSPGHQS
jgi:hypothetical protein